MASCHTSTSIPTCALVISLKNESYFCPSARKLKLDQGWDQGSLLQNKGVGHRTTCSFVANVWRIDVGVAMEVKLGDCRRGPGHNPGDLGKVRGWETKIVLWSRMDVINVMMDCPPGLVVFAILVCVCSTTEAVPG